MPRMHAIVDRFPEHELTIHRLGGRDAAFRSICADYDEALRAYRNLAVDPGRGQARLADYQEFLSDIEREIAELIAAAERSQPPRPARSS